MEKFSLRILSALLALAAGACTYPFQAELDEMEDVLVVEGNIVIGSRSTIALSKMVPLADLGASDAAYPEDPTYYEKTALRSYSVRIEGEDGSRVEAEGDNPYTLDTRDLPSGQRYKLHLEDPSGSNAYETDWLDVLGVPEVDQISHTFNGDILTIRASMHSDQSPYFSISYDEVWEYHAWADTRYFYGKQPREDALDTTDPETMETVITYGDNPYYRCWSHSDFARSKTLSAEAYKGNRLEDYPVISFFRNDARISVLYNLQLKASLISPEAYRYWQNLDKISTPSGDLFTPIPSSMRGNIHKVGDPSVLVLGYIGASTATAVSYFVDNSETQFYKAPAWQQQRVLHERQESGMNTEDWDRMYRTGYRPFQPVTDMYSGQLIGYMWINQDCVDCRRQGGATVKPEGWPK